MDEYLYNIIKRYFTTLASIGKINKEEKNSLFVLTTILNIYNTFHVLVSKEDTLKFNKYIHCLVNKKTCLFNKLLPELTYTTVSNSLVTIIDNDVITTQSGDVLVSQTDSTQNFTDFEIRTDFQTDNYVVGYDESSETEIKYNVSDLGVFWDVDL